MMNPEHSSEKRSRQLSTITSPKNKLEFLRQSTEADLQSCQSTCMDTISVREMEVLPNLNSELGEVLPKLIKTQSNRCSDTENSETH